MASSDGSLCDVGPLDVPFPVGQPNPADETEFLGVGFILSPKYLTWTRMLLV